MSDHAMVSYWVRCLAVSWYASIYVVVYVRSRYGIIPGYMLGRIIVCFKRYCGICQIMLWYYIGLCAWPYHGMLQEILWYQSYHVVVSGQPATHGILYVVYISLCYGIDRIIWSACVSYCVNSCQRICLVLSLQRICMYQTVSSSVVACVRL